MINKMVARLNDGENTIIAFKCIWLIENSLQFSNMFLIPCHHGKVDRLSFHNDTSHNLSFNQLKRDDLQNATPTLSKKTEAIIIEIEITYNFINLNKWS